MTLISCYQCDAALYPDARFCYECGTPVERDTSSLAQRLQEDLGEDYDVMGELGRGGFGIVFLVGDRHNHRYLAVKVMRTELTMEPALVKRFRREIDLTRGLEHPNILSVVFAAEKRDLVYYAMPRVRGKTLSTLMGERGPLPTDEVVRILCDVGSGLIHAHRQYVIHRDIKPSNVMIDQNSRALILDFGIAKALSGTDSSISIQGQLIGSPEYMSPEQAANRKDLDRRTDIYSWGVMGFAMLAGHPPFTGPNPQAVLYQHMTKPPPYLASIRSDVPEHLCRVIERALTKDRSQRWSSLEEALGATRGTT